MRFAAVLFDLDGTLLDTLEDIADAANEVLTSQGMPTHSLDAYRRFVGAGVRRLMEQALPVEHRGPEMIARCVQLFAGEYERCWNAKTRPYAGIRPLVESLQALRLPLAVLSNKPQRFTERCVDYYFPAGTFACVLGQREGVPAKPDPAGALEIASRLSLPADRVAYVGDSDIDMRTAVGAGMHPIGVEWGFRSREELLASGAAAVIDHPHDLYAVLGG